MGNIVFTPIKIGNVEFKNRVIFPSMCAYYCDKEGYINDRYTAFIMERARGGAGGIVIPGSPYGRPGPGRPALSDDRFIPGWQELAKKIQSLGVRLICQLHPVPFSPPRVNNPNNPSDYPKDFIEELVGDFVAIAVRAQKIGVDCVEVHGAHGHELAVFTSPSYNKRTDEYGGDYIGRAKFGCDIVRAIKKACGKDFPVIYRMNGEDKIAEGIEKEEAAKIAKLLEEAGADAIHISGGLPPKEYYASASMDFDDCLFADAAAHVRKSVNIPVISVGRIVDVSQAQEIIDSGKADMVAMGRAMLADPELVNKAEGTNDLPTRRCIGCNQGCRDMKRYMDIQCMQNPVLGREYSFTAPEKRDASNAPKVMIVGAGPAGLEAAVTLAQYGVKPEIYDRENEPGGLVKLSKIAPRKQNMDSLTKYRKEMLDYYGIKINQGIEVDKDLILREKPDALIIATGSEPLIPRIPGLDPSAVITGDDVFRQKGIDGKRIAVIGGGLVGCEAAEFLREQGKDVEVFEMQSEIAGEMYMWKQEVLVERMTESGISMHVNSKVTEIRLPQISVEENGKPRVYDGFDNVVVAVGRKPDRQLAQQLEGLSVQTYEIGDIKAPSFALDAVRDGFDAAIDILRG